jgi:putative pyrimidine permease RutG
METNQMAFFPRWTLKTDGEVAPDERLPWPQTIAMGVQHVVAMFGATALAPILMGFDPNTAIFFSGIGTLIFFVLTGGRLPSYLGSSFAFIAVVIAATAYPGTGPNLNVPVALGGILAAGALYALVGLVVQVSGTAWLEALMPPVVTGSIAAAIGLNLAPVAVKNISGTSFDTSIGLLTAVAVALIAVSARGLSRRLPILLGAICGYVLYVVGTGVLGFGKPIDFSGLEAATWFGLPRFESPPSQRPRSA